MTLGAVGAMAQGQIQAQNGGTGIPGGFPILITAGGVTNVLGTGSTNAFGIGPKSVIVQLWVGTNGSATLFPIDIGTNSQSTVAGSQGNFVVGTGNPENLPAPFDGTFVIEYLYKAWSINTGASSYAQAMNASQGYVGQSAMGFVQPVVSPNPAVPPTFGTGPGQIPAGTFVLAPVPEPSTIALAGLGAASLLLFRRRK